MTWHDVAGAFALGVLFGAFLFLYWGAQMYVAARRLIFQMRDMTEELDESIRQMSAKRWNE